jgi:hypothetical protein
MDLINQTKIYSVFSEDEDKDVHCLLKYHESESNPAYKAPVLTLYSVEVIIFSIAHYKVLKKYGSQISKHYKRIIMLY